MSGSSTRASGAPGVLLFVMPFAAPAGVRHAEKLVDCLAPASGRLFVAADERLDLSDRPAHVARAARLPYLHYLGSRRPRAWSAALWAMQLCRILARASWAVVQTRRQIDVVVCFLGVYYTPVLLCARLLGKKVVSFEPGSDVAQARAAYGGGAAGRLLTGAMRLLRRANRALADVCGVESPHLVEQAGMRPVARKVRTANLYVDTEHYRATTPLRERRPIVGFVGRLAAAKGVLPLLEAAAALRGEGVSFQLLGDGPLRGEVEAALRRPELAHVELVGWVGAGALAERLNGFRLLALPTVAEGLPNALLEAMACGTPVLATAAGGVPDLVQDGETGFILPDREPSTIASAIRAALADPELAAIAARGRAHVRRNYSLAASTGQWRAILAELVPAPTATAGEGPARHDAPARRRRPAGRGAAPASPPLSRHDAPADGGWGDPRGNR